MEKVVCKKVYFSSKAFADEEIKRLSKTSTRDKKPIRSYLCARCNSWHLTSAPARGVASLQLEIESLRKDLQLEKENSVRLTNKIKSTNGLVEERNNRIKNLEKNLKEDNKNRLEKLETQNRDYKERLANARSRDHIVSQFFSILSSQSNSKEMLNDIKKYINKQLEEK